MTCNDLGPVLHSGHGSSQLVSAFVEDRMWARFRIQLVAAAVVYKPESHMHTLLSYTFGNIPPQNPRAHSDLWVEFKIECPGKESQGERYE